MIILKNAKLLGEGMERICYLHPENENQVVKIPQKAGENGSRQNEFEFRSYRYILKRTPEITCISKCYGFTKTDMGEGLVCQCIRDWNGAISRSLHDILLEKHDYDYAKILYAVSHFGSYLIENNVQLFDLNVKNLVVQINENDYTVISIDLKGRYANNEFLPFSTYIPFFSRRKLKRRYTQLLERIDYCRKLAGER